MIESVNSFLEPHRARREELAKDMDYVRDVLAEGNKKANAIANETLEQVRQIPQTKKIHLRYMWQMTSKNNAQKPFRGHESRSLA